jgi:hypothetical protein
MRAVYVLSDWLESVEEEILVTRVKEDEDDNDAILRAMELFGNDKKYYIKD